MVYVRQLKRTDIACLRPLLIVFVYERNTECFIG